MNLFKLVGSIFIDTEEANDSLAKTDEKAQKTGASFKDIAKKAVGVGTAVVGAGVAAGTALTKMAINSSDATDEIDKMSQKLGMSRQAYQEWDYVLGQAGVDINSMETGMKTLTNQIGKAQNGSEDAAKNFEMLGISMEDIATMSREEIFAKTIEGFQNLEDSTERAALANAMFGKSGQNLTPLFNETSESTQGLITAAHELGLVMSDEAITAGVSLHDTIDSLQKSFSALITNLGASLMPLVEEFAQFLLELMPTIQESFAAIAPILGQLFSTLMPPLMQLVQMLLPVLTDIILPTLVNLLNAVMPILEPIMGILSPIINLLMTLLQPLLDLINLIFPPIIKLGTDVANLLVKTFGKAVEAACKIFNTLKTTVGNVFKALIDLVRKPVNSIIGFINGLIRGIVGGVNGVIRALNRFQIKVPDWITKLTGIKSFGFNLGEVSAPQIPLLATGGDAIESGSAIVGERGAELVELPKGARVTPLGDDNKLSDKLDTVIDLLRQVIGMGVYLDSGALVGQIGTQMDRELGRLAVKAERWA